MKNFSIVRNWKIFFTISIVFLLIGYGSMILRGFNLGIDFTGGSIMDLKFENEVQVAQVREVLSKHDLGGAIIQLESNDTAATSAQGVLIRTPVIADNDRTAVMHRNRNRIICLNLALLQCHFNVPLPDSSPLR